KCSNLSQFENPCLFATPDCPADNQSRQLALFFIRDVVSHFIINHLYSNSATKKNLKYSLPIKNLISMKYLHIISVLILVLTISCSKDDDQTALEKLPPATQTGAQTFGCLING